MPATPASSQHFSARLIPVGCEPDWRIATLTAMLAATAALLLVLVPPPRILAPMALLLSLATAEFVAAWRARSPDALRLFADGRVTVVFDGRELPVSLGSGGMFGSDFALIRWRAGQRAGFAGWTLFLRCDNGAAWSRGRCIWRWAPRGGAAPLV